MPDLGTYGANSRFQGEGLSIPSTPDEAQSFILDWWVNWVEAMGSELPSKFSIAGIANGGYQAGLFASKYPDRIDKLLMLSPQVACPPEFWTQDEDETDEQKKNNQHIFKSILDTSHSQLVSSLKYDI